jgi:survival-of-motor-neuron-related-splicing factor 30
MSDIASLEADIKQYQEQLDVVNGGLKDEPGNQELLALKSELDDAIGLLNETLAELKPAEVPAPKSKAPSPPTVQEKWSRENHPAFKKATPADDKETDNVPVHYKVNDNIMAKWVSGDKSFYPARITSITGSSTDPIYIVKFKSYDTTEQLRSRDIRPIAQKRKADGTPAHSSAPAAPSPVPSITPNASDPGVISAAANINLELAQKSREAAQANAGDAKPKAKKIKATRELEAGKNSWKDFNTKSKFAKGQKAKKDSMFRTPEGVHGRVGFTGSGQAMRKDPTRSRHIYQANEDLD